jgi:hypothetical protein
MMANNNNNHANSTRIIQLDKSKLLKDSGLVIDSVYYIDTHNIKISLNHNACADIIFTLDCKKWQNNLNTIAEMAEENGVYDKKSKQLLQRHLNDNHDKILTFSTNITNPDKNQEEVEEEKSKRKIITTFKYSKMGKVQLHEAVIVDGLPFFVKYNHITRTFELVEKIEESSRILRPPNIEDYPSSPPYSFDSNKELAFFMQKAGEVTLDELFKFSKIIFLKYVDQDEYIVILLAADSIWTYFQDLFPATHYGEGVGTNDVGKSSMGYTFEYTGYRVIKATAISGANYSRVLGSIEPGQCVIIEDEGDNISEDPEKVKILKAGYEYNSKIPKINMNTTNQEQKWYFAFCYKMILAEKSLKEYKARGLVDRTFSFPCRPGKVKHSIKEIVSQNINKSPSLQKLYDELLSFRKLMLCYRLIHHKDLLSEIDTGLENREQELCKPLLQLFYGTTEALNKEIIPTLETFVKQRRTRKGNRLEAALYPIIKKFVFSEAGLDYETNTYFELKQKKTTVKVPFYRIWDYIKEGDGGIDGQYDANKKYQYETMDHSTLYLNSLPTLISNKFAAEIKKQNYGKAIIFDVEKLERFEDLYSDSHLKGDDIKIEVKPTTAFPIEKGDDYDNYDDFDNFLGSCTNSLEKKDNEKEVILLSTEHKIDNITNKNEIENDKKN